jgi:anti-anti-sigma factor
MPLQKWSDQIWVAQLFEEPAFSDDLETVFSQFRAAETAPHVVVDLAGVNKLNSSNLAQLLRLRKLVVDAGRSIKIAGPNNAVWTLFLTTSLDKIFEFSPDTSMALAELQLAG